MAYFEFNPFGNESLVLKFECDNCKHDVTSEEIAIPEPNYSADTACDSQTDNYGYAVCDNCGKEFDISIYSTYADGNGCVENLPEKWEIDIIENPEFYYEEQYEAISSNNLFFDTFEREIENLKKLNNLKLDNDSLENILKKQIHIGIIISMETYLSDAFINTVLSSKDFIRRFAETFEEFKEKSIKLSELFKHYDKIETTCKKNMLEVLYHNLSKIKGMYKATLEIDLGNIGELCKAVSIRHDLVHRNGKTKDGKDNVINSDTINNLILEMENFIGNINRQIEEKKLNKENHSLNQRSST
jgi:hypothetical protein